MNIIPYTGKRSDNSYVFEEEIKRILREKNISISFSPAVLEDLLSEIDINIEEKHKIILDTVNNLPINQNHNLSIVKNIMTMDGRLKNHLDKIGSFSNNYIDNGDIPNIIANDPRKNPITMSKLVKSSNTSMTPLFKVVTDMNIERDYSPTSYGKLLLEVRISSPLTTFKGYITSGLLENNYGIGFFSEYNKSVDSRNMFIVAHRTTNTPGNVVEFSIIRPELVSDSVSIYNKYLPLNINITPLIVGEAGITDTTDTRVDIIRINQSLVQSLPFPANYPWIYGVGNLSHNGHGPIDCVFPEYVSGNLNFSTNRMIKSKYYPGNRNKIGCKLTIPTKRKIRSKLFNIRIQPSSFDDPTEEVGSHIIKPTFGNSHFDMYNLFRSIYDFVDMRPYKCFGNIMINNTVIPVLGFLLDFNLGRVTFTISPYFTIPESLKDIKGIDSEYRGLRVPLIVFDTNINTGYSYKNNGYIGDVDGENNKYMMGFDSNPKSYNNKNASYNLSFIDIVVEIPDCTGLIGKLRLGNAFRYSGDFNKFNYDFTKHDHDSYPYPGENRDISGRIDDLSEIPTLFTDSLVLSTTDKQYAFVWVDNEDELISFSS